MLQNNSPFNKKQLTMAVAAAILGGSLVGCSSDSGGGLPLVASVAGNSTISTAGGDGGTGATAYAGDGSSVDLYNYGGLGGVVVKRSGSANAKFSSQVKKITPFYGTNPLMVTSDETVEVVPYYTAIADGVVVVAGTLYVSSVAADGVLRITTGTVTASATDLAVADGSNYRSSFNANELYTAIGDDTTADLAAVGSPYYQFTTDSIYLADGDDTTADARATGLSVASGATLTLELQDTFEADVDFVNDVMNEGTITTADYTATDRGDLRIYPSSLINKGTITTAGSGTVVNGGYITVWTDYSAISSGVITAAGADNAAGAGGNANYINFGSDYYTENTGDWDNSGGNGSTGNNGGNANFVYLYSQYGPARNSGNITLTGGNGDMGGTGNWFGIYNDAAGDVLNSGDIDTSGGAGSVTSGGDAGDIDLYGFGGRLASSGNITAMGGDAAANNNAGDGGYYYLYNANGYSSWGNGTTPQEGIDLSGDIILDGGNSSGTGSGGNGGNGGWFMAETDTYGNGNEYTNGDEAITLYGYTTIDTTGGDAQFAGEGGDVSLYTDYGWDDTLYTYTPGGPVTNGADIVASAGSYTGTANTGISRGGDVFLETSYNYADINPKVKVTNSGDITSNGANGLNATGNWHLEAGGIWAWGFNGVNNSGTITLNGGNDGSTDGDTTSRGGYSGWVEMYAELGAVVNSGNITANGGDAEYRAGYGSSWTALYGPSVKNSGKITGIGGASDNTIAGYSPGYGGWVWMMSPEPGSVKNSATITLTPGAGYSDVNPTSNGYYKVIGASCTGDC